MWRKDVVIGVLIGSIIVLSIASLVFVFTCVAIIWYQWSNIKSGDLAAWAGVVVSFITLFVAVVAASYAYKSNKIAIQVADRSEVVSSAALLQNLISQYEPKFKGLREFLDGVSSIDGRIESVLLEIGSLQGYVMPNGNSGISTINARIRGIFNDVLGHGGYADFVSVTYNLVEFSKSMSTKGGHAFSTLIIAGLPVDWVEEINSFSIFEKVSNLKAPLLGLSNEDLPFVQGNSRHRSAWVSMYDKLKCASEYLSSNSPDTGGFAIKDAKSLKDIGWVQG